MIVAIIGSDLRHKWVSNTIPPLTTQDVIGQFAWHFVQESQQEELKTRLSRCLALGEPQAYWVHAKIGGHDTTFRVKAERVDQQLVCLATIVPGEAKAMSADEISQLRLMAEGKSTTEIAFQLELSPSTVSRRSKTILRKLEADPQTLLRQFAQALS